MLAIWPWLSCPYNENSLVDLPSSVIISNYGDCQIVAGIIVTCQFHEFLNLFLADYLQFGSTISHSLMTLSIGIYDVREEMCATPSSSGFAQFFFQVSPHLLTIVTAHHFCPFGTRTTDTQ